MDDLGKQFDAFFTRTKKALDGFPLLAANDAENFFLDSWRRQAWIGNTTENWKKPKTITKSNTGKAILIKTGYLKRRTRIVQANWGGVKIINDAKYAAIHNDGFNGTERVKGFRRKLKSRNIKTKGKKTASGVSFVKPFSRHMIMPRRRFMGNSPYLMMKIERTFIYQLNKL